MDLQQYTLNEINKLETPADMFFKTLQEDYGYTFFNKKFIGFVENPNCYLQFNRGLFNQLTLDKLNLIREIFNNILGKYNNNNSHLKLYKDDNLDVFVFDNFVVRFYSYQTLLNKQNILDIATQHTNIEQILEQVNFPYYNFGYVVSEILQPIIISKDNMLFPDSNLINYQSILKLKEDIKEALTYLHQNGIMHKDVRLDNIGYRESNRSYVLFDLEGSIYENKTELYIEDFSQLDASIKFHKLAT
jgi:serine/threonine protein kinase